MSLKAPFASQVNFLDPQTTNEGQPYAPIRYKEIVKECYLISKNLNTSYVDLLKITPTEKNYMLEFLQKEAEHNKQMIEKARAEREARKKHY